MKAKHFKIFLFILLALLSYTLFSAEGGWRSLSIHLINRYGISIDMQPLRMSADKTLNWDGGIEPRFEIARPFEKNANVGFRIFGNCSAEMFRYISAIMDASPERDARNLYELEGYVPVAFFSVSTMESAKTLFQGKHNGYLELDQCAQITEMFFEDVERIGGLEERFKEDYQPMKTHIYKIIRGFQKTRAEVSYGGDKIVIIGNIINYRKLTDNKRFGMIVDIETNTKNITNYIKYSFDNLSTDAEYIGVKFRQNADEDNKLSDLDLEGESINTAFWNYLLDLFAKKDEKNSEQILKNKIAIKKIPARKIEIPSTFPNYMNTLEKAKTLALEAFKKKYQNVKLPNLETELNIPTPTQFAYKIIKLEGNVEHFAFAGTEILQIEMFNAQNELICAVWLNPEHKSLEEIYKNSKINFNLENKILEPSTTLNAAKEVSLNKESNLGNVGTLDKLVDANKTGSGKDENLDEKGNLSKESSLLKDDNLNKEGDSNKAFLSKNGGLDKADNSNKEGKANKEGNSNKESGLDKDSNLNKEATLNKKSNFKKENTPDEEHNIIKEIYALSELNSEPILFILSPVAVPLPPAPPPPPPYEPPVWDHEKYIREYYAKQKQKEEQNIKSHITSPVNSEPILFILPPVAVPLPPAPPPPPPIQPLTEQEYEEYLKKQSTKKNKN